MSNQNLLKLAARYKQILSKQGQATAPYTKVDPKVQKALNVLFPTFGLKVDGMAGPLTASAIESYKTKYNDTRKWNDPDLWKDICAKAFPKEEMQANTNQQFGAILQLI